MHGLFGLKLAEETVTEKVLKCLDIAVGLYVAVGLHVVVECLESAMLGYETFFY